jgi:hypothetical protein
LLIVTEGPDLGDSHLARREFDAGELHTLANSTRRAQSSVNRAWRRSLDGWRHLHSRVGARFTLHVESRRHRRVVRGRVLLPLGGVACDGGKPIAEVDVAVCVLERPSAISYGEECLGGEDLVEQLLSPFVDRGRNRAVTWDRLRRSRGNAVRGCALPLPHQEREGVRTK